MRPEGPRARSAGFTLIEVLVAFAIAALALGAFARASFQGARAARVAEQTQVALSLARSRLTLAAAAGGATLAAAEGAEGGYRWRLRVRPLAGGTPGGALLARMDPDSRAAAQLSRATLMQLEVTVAWGAGQAEREVRLETRRLVAGSPEGR